MNDDDIYARIADELARSDMDRALWTQAIAAADGDEAKTKAAYIKLRHKALIAQFNPKSSPGQAEEAGAQPSVFAADPKLIDMLVATGKRTLYSALKLSPGASQEEVKAACQRLLDQIRSGGTVPDAATVTYAIETLSDIDRRRIYDLSLLRGLQPPRPRLAEPQPQAARSDIIPSAFLSWWGTRRTLAVLLACGLLIAGGMILSYLNHSASRDIERARATTEQIEVTRSADNEAERVQTDLALGYGTVSNQLEFIRESARIEDRGLDIANRAETRKQAELQHKASANRETLFQSGRVIDNQERQADWARQQYEQERTRLIAEQHAARERANLIAIYLGRDQFRLARDVAKTQEEIRMIERAELNAQRGARRARQGITVCNSSPYGGTVCVDR